MAPVYAAKYSNVLVWVSTVKNVSVMRRQGDGWVNATHLLKVADFDKPRRTRILERDVQTGEHEKVQGGYGKYQGTWIPVERAMELSKEVGILDIVHDLLVYVPVEGVETAMLPKQPKPASTARKQTKSEASNGPASKPKRARKINSVPEPAQMTMVPRAQAMHSMPSAMRGNMNSSMGGAMNSARGPMNGAMNGAMNGSYQQMQWPQFSPQSPYDQPQHVQLTPQQLQHQQQQMGLSMPGMPQMPVVPMPGFPMGTPNGAMYQRSSYQDVNGNVRDTGRRSNTSSPSLSSSVLSSGSDGLSDDERPYLGGASFHRNRTHHTEAEPVVTAMRNSGVAGPSDTQLSRTIPTVPGPSQYMADYSSKLLDFFMSPDKSMIPSALLHPQPGAHINQPIDDEGNTAFHWTCAIGRIELMQALLDAGADKKTLNHAGQTPLVRAVMFTNNYEARTFSRVLEMLIETASLVDPGERTILHHIASTASSGSRSSGARYYTEILLGKLSASPELVSMGFNDWLNHQDHRGDTALHISSRGDSRRLAKILLSYHASPVIPNKAGITAEELLKRSHVKTEIDSKARISSHQSPEKHSQRGETAATQAARETSLAVSRYLLEFGKTYDTDLMNKDSDISQVRQLMDRLRKRASDTGKQNEKLQDDLGSEQNVVAEAEKLEEEAKRKSQEMYQLMERSQARDLALMVQKEESDIQDELKDQLKDEDTYDESEQTVLSRQLADMQRRRRSLLDEIVVLYGNAGSSEKIRKYRKLLAMCCEVPEEEVDGLLDGITHALGTQSA